MSIDTINRAFTLLGRKKINSITDPVTSDEKLAALWADSIRKELLEDGQFNFSTKRARIPKSVDTAEFGEVAVYPLPADYLKLLTIGENGYYITSGFRSEIVGGVRCLLLSSFQNSSGGEALPIRYVFDQINTALWSASFRAAYEFKLAGRIAMELNTSQTTVDKLEQYFDQAFKRACAQDSQESPLVRVSSSDLKLFRGTRSRDPRTYNDDI